MGCLSVFCLNVTESHRQTPSPPLVPVLILSSSPEGLQSRHQNPGDSTSLLFPGIYTRRQGGEDQPGSVLQSSLPERGTSRRSSFDIPEVVQRVVKTRSNNSSWLLNSELVYVPTNPGNYFLVFTVVNFKFRYPCKTLCWPNLEGICGYRMYFLTISCKPLLYLYPMSHRYSCHNYIVKDSQY